MYPKYKEKTLVGNYINPPGFLTKTYIQNHSSSPQAGLSIVIRPLSSYIIRYRLRKSRQRQPLLCLLEKLVSSIVTRYISAAYSIQGTP